MSDSIRQTIEEFEAKRLQQLAVVGDTERTINMLLQHIGESPRYADPGARDSVVSTTIKRGQFYGMALATAITQFLETRRREPATNEEIMDALNRGGFAFEWAEEGRIRSLAMSMSKNVKFHRLPDGSWGLREWYSHIPKKNAADAADEDAPEPKKANAAKSSAKDSKKAKAGKQQKAAVADAAVESEEEEP